MPQQTSTFESHFFILTHMQGVTGAYHKLIVYRRVPILQVGGLGKVRVNRFPKTITTWLGWESNPRPPDSESDALTTLPHCPLSTVFTLRPPGGLCTQKSAAKGSYRTHTIFAISFIPFFVGGETPKFVKHFPFCEINNT